VVTVAHLRLGVPNLYIRRG
jgi:hypothetical protein